MVASDIRPPAQQSTDFVDLEHVGPGTPAGNWLRRFWHPFFRSEDLSVGRAKPVRLLGEDFTLFRGESGEIHAVAFRCAHRGIQLSTGWVEGDTIRCFYHGWSYDGNGQCVEQPAEPEPFCNRIKIRSYPVEEYAGIVFAYLGEGTPPPLPRFGIVERANLREVETCIWPFSYRQALDNKQDLAHLPFVHRRTGDGKDGNAANQRPPTFPTQVVEEQEWGFTSTASYKSGVTAVEHILMPNCYLHKDRPGNPRTWDPPMGWDDTIRWSVPIDDEHHIDVSLNLAVATDEQIAEYQRRHAEAMAIEPAPVMELLQDVLQGRMTPAELAQYDLHGASGNLLDGVARWGQGTIPDRTKDHLGQTDIAPLTYRRIFEREIRALANGQPLQEWRWPLDLHATWSFTPPAQ